MNTWNEIMLRGVWTILKLRWFDLLL